MSGFAGGRWGWLLVACLCACDSESEPAAAAGACDAGGVVLQVEAGAQRVEHPLHFGSGVFSHSSGDFDSGAAIDTIFAAHHGPLLYVRVHGDGTGTSGPAPAWLVYRAEPSAPFLVSGDATLGWDVDGDPLEGGTIGVTFSASRLGRLPACDDVEPSGLQAEYCLGSSGIDCPSALVLTDEEGETSTLDVLGSGTIGSSFASFRLEGGGFGVYERTLGLIHDGVIIFGEEGPDPFSVYCVSGTVDSANKARPAKAGFDAMRRVGAWAEATPVAGTLTGKRCP